MKNYTTITVNKRIHVLCDYEPAPGYSASYQKTGLALCGILQPGESIPQWIQRNNIYRNADQRRRREIENEMIEIFKIKLKANATKDITGLSDL